MNAALALAVGLASGAGVGALYFVWLWRSIQGLEMKRHPAAWVAAGFALRLAFTLAAFGLLAAWGGLPALGAALGGFVLARTVLVRRMRLPRPVPGKPR